MGRSRAAIDHARMLRAIADRIQDDDTPLPAAVYETLAPLAPREAFESDDNDEEHPPGEENLTVAEWREVWTQELARRADNVRSGRSQGIPAGRVLEELRAELTGRLPR